MSALGRLLCRWHLHDRGRIVWRPRGWVADIRCTRCEAVTTGRVTPRV